MGCDIHSFAEKRDEHGLWQALPAFEPFEQRIYRVFAWLAGVRNYSAVTPLSEPRGLPVDASEAVRIEHAEWGPDAHTASWLSIQELLSFDFDAPMENRRVTRQISPVLWSGVETCEAGEGEMTTYRDFLGPWFFKDLEMLQELGAERIVFWFDN